MLLPRANTTKLIPFSIYYVYSISHLKNTSESPVGPPEPYVDTKNTEILQDTNLSWLKSPRFITKKYRGGGDHSTSGVELVFSGFTSEIEGQPRGGSWGGSIDNIELAPRLICIFVLLHYEKKN